MSIYYILASFSLYESCNPFRYGALKKEVDGMAVLMNEVGEDEKVEIVVEEVEVTDSEEEEEEDEEEVEDEEDDEGIEEVEQFQYTLITCVKIISIGIILGSRGRE